MPSKKKPGIVISYQWAGMISLVATFAALCSIMFVVDAIRALKFSSNWGIPELLTSLGVLLLTIFTIAAGRTAFVFGMLYLGENNEN